MRGQHPTGLYPPAAAQLLAQLLTAQPDRASDLFLKVLCSKFVECSCVLRRRQGNAIQGAEVGVRSAGLRGGQRLLGRARDYQHDAGECTPIRSQNPPQGVLGPRAQAAITKQCSH